MRLCVCATYATLTYCKFRTTCNKSVQNFRKLHAHTHTYAYMHTYGEVWLNTLVCEVKCKRVKGSGTQPKWQPPAPRRTTQAIYCCAYRLLCIHTLNGTWWSMKLRNNNNTHKHSRKSDDQTQAKLARRLTQRLNLHIGKCAKLQVACKRRAKTKNKNKKKSATTRAK